MRSSGSSERKALKAFAAKTWPTSSSKVRRGRPQTLQFGEATLILDNRDRQLNVDADEVHVTRRVFRSGESEYLINREPRRLKDIRDLFRGTGVGVDAYSLIEQGKIDRMLQASAKDRRAIFEEAAGISRFKTKKVETDRRLQRVEQSLVRLKDIVDEVHTRLATLKNQATKAQQYREMTARLSELRLRVGIDDHRSILQKLAELQTSLADNEAKRFSLSEQLAQATQRVEEAENKLAVQISETEEAQNELQRYREKIAGLESSQTAFRDRLLELGHEKSLNLARQVALEERADYRPMKSNYKGLSLIVGKVNGLNKPIKCSKLIVNAASWRSG